MVLVTLIWCQLQARSLASICCIVGEDPAIRLQSIEPILVMLDSSNIVECTESWNDCANGALNCTQTGAVPPCSGISGVFLMESTNSEERRKEESGM